MRQERAHGVGARQEGTQRDHTVDDQELVAAKVGAREAAEERAQAEKHEQGAERGDGRHTAGDVAAGDQLRVPHGDVDQGDEKQAQTNGGRELRGRSRASGARCAICLRG